MNDTATAAKTPAEVPLEERQKRMAVFAKARQTVLVKFFAMAPLPGLEKKGRSEGQIDLLHAIEADARGLDFQAYREKGDTGFCLFQKEQVVSISGLDQLQALGLQYTGGHWQTREGRGPVSTLQFSTIGEAIPLPSSLRSVLASTYNSCTIWCNLKYADEGDAQFRLDTITVAKRLRSDDPRVGTSRRLSIEGNTYRLV